MSDLSSSHTERIPEKTQSQRDLESYARYLGWTELEYGLFSLAKERCLLGVPPPNERTGNLYSEKKSLTDCVLEWVPRYDQSLDLIVPEVEKLDIEKQCKWHSLLNRMDFKYGVHVTNAPAHLRLRALVETVEREKINQPSGWLPNGLD